MIIMAKKTVERAENNREEENGDLKKKNLKLTRTGIRIQYGNALFAGSTLEKPLLRSIVACARQTREVNQQRNFDKGICAGLRWDVEIEVHLAFCGGSIVGDFEELAAE